ncbi:hypothetical protein FNW02_25025 [Komarekiella sp. 'clone 1']|uniref:Uncharacterized protein n=1 Tax=Komarekiella delphini-convector SJRDD-AB1 TaxID=2593771 RepID=A0AA40T1I5_9NOST|nr:hypothetical protein [Komarekiella delphini-convector]MBD6618995.1 hypothetical protein [Komarekiella delphini-convector SJRDD-AB1]
MRAKLLNVLTVCVVTLVVLSPELVVFGVVWERHINLVESQNLTCKVNESSTWTPQPNGTHFSQSQASTKPSDRNVVNQMLTVAEQYKLATILQWFFVLTPICLGLGIIFYDRYLFYRAAVLKEQVEMLERLWQQSIEQ